MTPNEYLELQTMLLIENRSYCSDDKGQFYKYLNERYDLDKFNERYIQLLDKFLNKYALNNTEKSEEHD